VKRSSAGVMDAIAWVAASLAVLGVVVRHDAMVKSYWEEQYNKNSLFLTQRYVRVSGELPAESVKRSAIWLAIMRYEADFSVGLLVASAGIVLVSAARRLRARRTWSGPGAVACVVAVAAMGLCLLEEASEAAKEHRGLWGKTVSNPFPNAWPHCELRIGLAVLGAWVVMAGMRRWRPRRAWADRIGVAIGVLWLVVILYRIGASLFIPFGNWGY
jgi:hypothetical protein